jgi:hypothetical protein
MSKMFGPVGTPYVGYQRIMLGVKEVFALQLAVLMPLPVSTLAA